MTSTISLLHSDRPYLHARYHLGRAAYLADSDVDYLAAFAAWCRHTHRPEGGMVA